MSHDRYLPTSLGRRRYELLSFRCRPRAVYLIAGVRNRIAANHGVHRPRWLTFFGGGGGEGIIPLSGTDYIVPNWGHRRLDVLRLFADFSGSTYSWALKQARHH